MLRAVIGCCVLLGCYDPKLECPYHRCNDLTGVSEVDGSTITDDARVADAAPAPGMPSTPPPIDAPPPPIDAPPPPPKPCAPGCAGTCDDGVCVIDCIGEQACDHEVVCPLSGPCRVTCNGRKACHKGVRCGFGHCVVTCNGDDACKKRVRCDVACACDVTCGPDACKDDAVCSKPWCEAGDGCTSTPASSCSSC